MQVMYIFLFLVDTFLWMIGWVRKGRGVER